MILSTATQPIAAELTDLYLTQKLSQVQIGRRFGVCQATVRYWMKAAAIPSRPHDPRRGKDIVLPGSTPRTLATPDAPSCINGKGHHWHCDPPNGEFSRGVCQVCGEVKMMSNVSRWEKDERKTNPNEHPV